MTIDTQQLASVIGSRTPSGNNIKINHIITDSRALLHPADTAFFAIRTHLGDGHEYIPRLYARGVRCFVVALDYQAPDDEAIYMHVDDPLAALQALGVWCRNRLTCPVVAITGSVGKTIVKEMLFAATNYDATVARSPRSWNSQVGVPQALWHMRLDARLAIVEAGISKTGEMTRLLPIIRPTIGILTPLTSEHDEGFESLEAKCIEKCLLFKTADVIYYLSNDLLADRILHQLYPDKRLVACSDYAAIAKHVTGTSEEPKTVSARVDFTDSDNGVLLAYDYYTADPDGITTGLDIVRRRIGPDADIAVILGDIQGPDESYAQLSQVFADYGVTRLLTISPKAQKHLKHLKIAQDAEQYTDARQMMTDTARLPFYNESVYIAGADKDAMREVATWLSNTRNITRLEVNLDAIAHNYKQYRALLPQHCGIIGMVKADGYGCGAVEIARTLQQCGASMVAVAVVDEGVKLRKNGVTLPIIVLDPWCDNMRAIFANDLQPTIIDAREETIRMISDAATRQGLDLVHVHLKIDTGMHRVGLSEEEIPRFLNTLVKYPNIRLASIFSHLATADCSDKQAYTRGQLEKFNRMSAQIAHALGYPVKRHVLNTAGMTLYGRDTDTDFCRLGIGLYGISPLSPAPSAPALKPVARFVTRIIASRRYPSGTTIGYGCRGVLTRDSLIATIPVGYADGLLRALGNGRASFLVNGKPCPTIGNICMDLCMIDVTDTGLTDPIDTEVEIFGPDLPIERLANALNTIPYEVLAEISPRVKRIYIKS